MSLALVIALQLLTPRARAVLILRDVLGFTAREAADLIGSSQEAVAMTLSRARRTLRQHTPSPGAPPARSGTSAKERIARRLATALAAHDIDAVVSLLTDDIQMTMPPLPAIWQGRESRRRVPDRGGVPAGPRGTLRRDTRKRATRPGRLYP